MKLRSAFLILVACRITGCLYLCSLNGKHLHRFFSSPNKDCCHYSRHFKMKSDGLVHAWNSCTTKTPLEGTLSVTLETLDAKYHTPRWGGGARDQKYPAVGTRTFRLEQNLAGWQVSSEKLGKAKQSQVSLGFSLSSGFLFYS